MPCVSLHWFRRDLRLTDNTALHHAARSSERVVPVYILSGWKQQHRWTGPKRQHFLCGCLESLSKNIGSIGSNLIIRQGPPDEEIERLIKETGAGAVFTNRDPDPFGKAMERRVAGCCARLGIEFHSFKDCVLHEPDEALTGEGRPYRVFTPYSRNWLALQKSATLPRVNSLGRAPATTSLPLPSPDTWHLQSQGPDFKSRVLPPGERAARQRMKHFLGHVLSGYGHRRDIPSGQTTSRLSQDLRFGLISIRELHEKCAAIHADPAAPATVHASALTFMKELAWREFYMAVLHHWPEVLETDFNEKYRNVCWDSDETLLAAWQAGRTGFPIVDAGMRQLLATGFMHNRVRMITAMFLTKDLHVHWRLGESFFMQHLVDGEIASNNGGWQWSAGTGADAAPYFRIQNPWTQTKRYDPEAAYIKAWLPELKDLPADKLMSPPESPLHPDYPLPIVDHRTERDRTLARFKDAI